MKSQFSLTLGLPVLLAGSAFAQNVPAYVNPAATYANPPVPYGQTVTRTTVEYPNLQPGAPGISGTGTIIGTPSTTTRTTITYGTAYPYPVNPYPSYGYPAYTPAVPYSAPLTNPANSHFGPPSVTVIPLGRTYNNGYYGGYYGGYPTYSYPYPTYNYPVNTNPYCGNPYPVYVQPNCGYPTYGYGYSNYGVATRVETSNRSAGVGFNNNGVSVNVNSGRSYYSSQTRSR